MKKLVWAREFPDFDKLQFDLYGAFNKIMEEVVFLFEEDLEVAMCRDGLILIKYQKLESERQSLKFNPPNTPKIDSLISFHVRYVKIINIFQNSLASSANGLEEWFSFLPIGISVQDIIPCSFEDGEFKSASFSDNIVSQYVYGGRHASSYSLNGYKLQDVLKFDARTGHRLGVVSENLFDKACELTKRILSNDIIFNIVDGLCVAISENASMNYNQSLVQSWFIIERFINIKWEEFILLKNSEDKKISKTRKDFLQGRDFTASIMSNILELNSVIDDRIFSLLDQLRRKRNSIAHNLKNKSGELISADREDCKNAFEVVNYFLDNEYKISIKTDYGVSIMGV